jgi:thymidylate kinase
MTAPRADTFASIAAGLDRAGVEWCMLGGYRSYPEDITPDGQGDVDLLVSRRDFSRVPKILAQIPDLRIVQARLQDATSIRYELWSNPTCRPPLLLGLDVYCEIRDLGTILIKPEEFLDRRRRFRDALWIPEPAVEFAYYLLKRCVKRHFFGAAFEARHEARLNRLYHDDPDGCRRQLARFFPRPEAALIARAAERGDWTQVHADMPTLLRRAKRKLWLEHPGDVLRCTLTEVRRRFWRLRHRTGVVVAFLGLDGCGKSTVMARVGEDLLPAFRSAARFHLRPHLGQRAEPAVAARVEPARGWALSIAKLMVWAVDYVIGYLVRVFPPLIASTLVLFDRYYHDLLVDPIRYRYGGPVGLARWVGRRVPHPDLMILLDAPPEIATARKQDPLRGTRRERERYLELVRALPNGCVVDASLPLDDVVAEAERIVLRYMHERTTRRLGL